MTCVCSHPYLKWTMARDARPIAKRLVPVPHVPHWWYVMKILFVAVVGFYLFSAAISRAPPLFSRWMENSPAGRIHYNHYNYYDWSLLAMLHYCCHPHAHLLTGGGGGNGLILPKMLTNHSKMVVGPTWIPGTVKDLVVQTITVLALEQYQVRGMWW